MKKDCKLIGTLPRLRDEKSISEIMLSDEISEVRYNSGINDLLSSKEVVDRLKRLSELYNKKIWIDLKGRQLRVNSWGDAAYEVIELSHDIEVEYPAKVMFRSGNSSNIIHTRENKIILDLPPQKALGKGQSVNIKAKSLDIKGYLTDNDKMLIRESAKVNMNDYMASFVESKEDIDEIIKYNNRANIISKIESYKRVEFINMYNNLSLMAARDDLYIETDYSISMLKILKKIISKDNNAICASRIFSSLDSSSNVSLSDYEDLELMYSYGYRNFMLQDDVKGDKLKRTLKAWRSFINE